jgi:hypothetical protein
MATSVALCLPTALAQGGEHALGNHPGEEVLRRIAKEAGLSHWRHVADSPLPGRVPLARQGAPLQHEGATGKDILQLTVLTGDDYVPRKLTVSPCSEPQ